MYFHSDKLVEFGGKNKQYQLESVDKFSPYPISKHGNV